MSAIAGLMAAGDRRDLAADLTRALDVLAAYGPDRSGERSGPSSSRK